MTLGSPRSTPSGSSAVTVVRGIHAVMAEASERLAHAGEAAKSPARFAVRARRRRVRIVVLHGDPEPPFRGISTVISEPVYGAVRRALELRKIQSITRAEPGRRLVDTAGGHRRVLLQSNAVHSLARIQAPTNARARAGGAQLLVWVEHWRVRGAPEQHKDVVIHDAERAGSIQAETAGVLHRFASRHERVSDDHCPGGVVDRGHVVNPTSGSELELAGGAASHVSSKGRVATTVAGAKWVLHGDGATRVVTGEVHRNGRDGRKHSRKKRKQDQEMHEEPCNWRS